MQQKNILMAIFAYLGPLVIVSYIVAKDDSFVKYHIKQGLVLFLAEVILWLFGTFFFWSFWMLYPLVDLVDLAIFVLAILGIINASQGKEKELPIVGGLGSQFKI